MGAVLQIRVSAETFSEKEVRNKWPELWKLIWDEGGDAVPRKGVLELAQAVFNAVRAGLVDSRQADALRENAEAVEKMRLRMQEVLANRQPGEADKLSYEIEDCLDDLEDIAAKF